MNHKASQPELFLPWRALIGASLALVLLACASTPTRAPGWVERRPNDTDHYIGVGFAAVVGGDRTAAREAADAGARRNLAAEIETVVRGRTEDVIHESGTALARTSREEIRQETLVLIEQTVGGSEIVARWYDEQRQEWHSYARLSKQAFERRLTEREAQRTERREALSVGLDRTVGAMLEAAENRPGGILVGNVTYQDEELPSVFGRYVESQLTAALSSRRFLRILPRERFELQVRPDFMIDGSFFRQTDGVRIFLTLRDFVSGEILSTRDLHVTAEGMPAGIALEPDRLAPSATAALENIVPVSADAATMLQAGARPAAAVEPSVGAAAGALQVAVRPDRGRGATYREGDPMVIVLETNKDAYVKLFLLDAEGHTTLVFPNRFQPDNRLRAGETRQIGGPNDPFRIQVSPPHGVEVLKAVASTRQFSDYPALLERFRRGDSFDKVASVDVAEARRFMTRGLAIVGQERQSEMAEDTASYSVLAPGAP